MATAGAIGATTASLRTAIARGVLLAMCTILGILAPGLEVGPFLRDSGRGQSALGA